jgi:rubrerythrin
MEDGRKTYYVAVGSGQVLEDRGAAPFEFEIRANEEELNKLQELFEETSSAEEASVFHFVRPITTRGEEDFNAVYEAQMKDIYRLLYQLGTDETRRHILSMNVLDGAEEQPAVPPC